MFTPEFFTDTKEVAAAAHEIEKNEGCSFTEALEIMKATLLWYSIEHLDDIQNMRK